MTDYAGPILGAVGAVIGFYAGGPAGAQWGWAIGSAVGGMYSASQQVIPGPKIGEVARQTSQEGGFRPIVYGRSQPIHGNIIADGGPVIVTRTESQGKGGPKVESESAFRTYAVGFCEGEATLLQAWRNGILVYDIEDPSMAAENAKFLEYATWYTGSFDQNASPDLESIYGVGQAPYFRGTAYLSIHEEDVTDQRGAWSQWQVRVFRGSAQSYTTPPYPVLSEDKVSARSLALDGLNWFPPSDDIDAGSYALDGVQRELILYYDMVPEEVEAFSYALDGIQRPMIVYYDIDQEDVEAGSYSLDGTLRLVQIDYLNYLPEEVEAASYSLGGTKA